VRLLRRAGVMKDLTGRTGGDSEYQQFVRETHFSFQRDLDAVAGEISGPDQAFVLMGRLDWALLRKYAIQHGGRCAESICTVLSSHPGRQLAFTLIQPDVLLVRASAANSGPPSSAGRRREPLPMPSRDAVWVSISPVLLHSPADIPPGLRLFAIVVQSAHPVVLSLGPASSGSKAAFELKLRAHCSNVAMADTMRNQLQIETNMIRLALAKQRKQPNEADLTGLVASGTFQVVDNDVIGQWPISKALINSLR
jgi:hypothetical protein